MNLYDEDDAERAETYELFAGLFLKEPTTEVLLQMKEMFRMTFDETFTEIGIDFRHLFSGSEKHPPPCESLYNYPVGDKPRLWGRMTEEVRELYRSAGLMIDEEIDLIPDHVSAELLFMGYLIDNGLEEVQAEFLDEHLLKWIPPFCEEVKNRAETTFYKEVADLLKEFILSDYEQLTGND